MLTNVEAGYSLRRKRFFDNIGAITLYAMIGTLTSTFIVGFLTFYSGRMGLIKGIDTTNPMEALLFGALISAVDPVATLSIMGSPELHCNELLYSLVFGESVLNDAIAIVLFKTFHKYYDPNSPDFTKSEIPSALLSFFNMTIMSILVGVGLGLLTSYIYKHTSIHQFPRLESTLLFLFCYCCYATAEAFELSGIMALFFNGICLGHYNSYNLSHDSRQATEKVSCRYHCVFLSFPGSLCNCTKLTFLFQFATFSDLCYTGYCDGDDSFPLHGNGRLYRKI